ncbi:carbamoyltransferase HypF [Goodfellowiella coeruleoviolacea]|nr:carbamoyltransferase HypF [Goodfellowiella coeruleoviolacea]
MSVRVAGTVQGVGFRPFVHGLATRLGLAGHVGNDSAGVFLEVEGESPAVRDFLLALRRDAPPLALVDEVTAREIAPVGGGGFTIVASRAHPRAGTAVSADSATCADCLRELFDPTDRRYRYPFVNCVNCGPRFTIVRGVPYDRRLTTMAGFAMCADCAREYADPADRRFHAQPVCCPACGPRLRLVDPTGTAIGPALESTVELIRAGLVVAVKGLGGYHLAVDAGQPDAVARLRRRKHRADKPFALMVPDLAAAERLCAVDPTARRLLTGHRRPIVLLPRRCPADGTGGTGVAEQVAPGSHWLGLLLPYTPLHHLLLADLARPIVLTSANVSDEPIVYRDEDALHRLTGIADAVLTHDRPIHVRADDSVVRPARGGAQVLRRARGYAPEPLSVPVEFPRPVLACGAELKNTFCLGTARQAVLAPHLGDLTEYRTWRSFVDGIGHLTRLTGVRPEVLAHDLHPDYLSTRYARDRTGVALVGVQHHHAHIAACLADNHETGPVLGVAFDGLGYGVDGTIWGGEFLLADLTGFQRLAHLAPVPMPGGPAAVRQPWRMAAAYLDAAYRDAAGGVPEDLAVLRRNAARWHQVTALARTGTNAPATTSAGRLFDAVAALLGRCDAVSYEGQAAIALEHHADPAERGRYHAAISTGQPAVVSGVDLVRACAEDLRAGVAGPVIAARFHNGVADAVVRVCVRLRELTGQHAVALSGGVFQNQPLVERVVSGLTGLGFRVLTHVRVPPNDGGVSLGQAVVAAARDRAGLVRSD